jgi:exonuclease III
MRLNTNNSKFDNLFSPRYELYHNSTTNKRGVGILISRSLQYTLIQQFKDDNNNILVLRLNVCGTEVLIASIYGPNNNDKKFFSDLSNFLGNT